VAQRNVLDYEEPRGPYTVWTDGGVEGWHWTDFDTLKEALTAERYTTRFVITKPVAFEVRETDTA
jgi:hypothetical protein